MLRNDTKASIRQRVVAAGLAVLACGGTVTDAASQTAEVQLASLRAIAYQPRRFVPGSESTPNTLAEIRDDLHLLRDAGFRSIVTYGADGHLAQVPRLAREIGFDGVIILGVWNPLSEGELRSAIGQAEYVDGYGIGNEGLGTRYSTEQLATAMHAVRAATGRPATTTEPIDDYLGGPYRAWLLSNSDWLFPLAHAFWADVDEPVKAVRWIVARYDLLRTDTGRPVVLKEIGFPSGGFDMHDEATQRDFYEALEKQDVEGFLFEAFDQPWKATNGDPRALAEPHWGLFRTDGTPKAAAEWLIGRWAAR